jgi:hypothetical protein
MNSKMTGTNKCSVEVYSKAWMPRTFTAHRPERRKSPALVTRAESRGIVYFLSDDAVEFDPLFSEPLEVSDLLSDDADADPLLPDEPFDDDFLA